VNLDGKGGDRHLKFALALRFLLAAHAGLVQERGVRQMKIAQIESVVSTVRIVKHS
jgi:hypothetical protein